MLVYAEAKRYCCFGLRSSGYAASCDGESLLPEGTLFRDDSVTAKLPFCADYRRRDRTKIRRDSEARELPVSGQLGLKYTFRETYEILSAAAIVRMRAVSGL